MKQQTKFTSQEQQKPEIAGQQTQQKSVKEFGSVEEMLRHDALHTPVPPTIAQRLQKSVAQEPPPRRSWWKNLFGR